MVYSLYSDTFAQLDDPTFVPTVLQEFMVMLRALHPPASFFPATAVPFYIFRVNLQPSFYYLEDKTNAENPLFDDYTWIMYLIEVLSHGARGWSNVENIELLERSSILIDELAAIVVATNPNKVVHLHAIYCRASYLFALGKFKMAKALLTRTMKMKEELYGLQHPCMPASMDMLAAIFKRDGDVKATKQLLERSLAINLKTYGDQHPLVAASYYRLAAMYHDLSQFADARPNYEACLAIREKVLGPVHPHLATICYRFVVLSLTFFFFESPIFS